MPNKNPAPDHAIPTLLSKLCMAEQQVTREDHQGGELHGLDVI